MIGSSGQSDGRMVGWSVGSWSDGRMVGGRVVRWPVGQVVRWSRVVEWLDGCLIGWSEGTSGNPPIQFGFRLQS